VAAVAYGGWFWLNSRQAKDGDTATALPDRLFSEFNRPASVTADKTEPAKPLASDESAKPTVSDESAKPMASDESAKPTVPDESAKPTVPDESAKAMGPDESAKATAVDETAKPGDKVKDEVVPPAEDEIPEKAADVAAPAKPEVAKPEVAKPEVAKPGAAKPGAPKGEAAKAPEKAKAADAKPDAAKTDLAKPEAAKPDAAKPEPAKPEPTKPEPAKPETVASAPADQAAATPAGGGDTAPSRIVIKAAADDCWMQVREMDGRLLLSKLLRRGDTFDVPDRPGLSLTVGNAGALAVTVDGKAVPSLGGVGQVRRDINLDPAKLLQGG
jgi:cytoskeleton protein RodZ